MRLTSVTHLRLPYGTLLGYDVTVGRRGDLVPVCSTSAATSTAGTGRARGWRSPAGCPRSTSTRWPRPGWRCCAGTDAAHGVLPGPAGPRLHEVDLRPGRWVTHPIASGQAVDDAVRRMLDERCTPTRRRRTGSV